MSEQDRIAQLVISAGGPGTGWNDAGSISIGAKDLWQIAPRSMAMDGYSVAYFVEAVTLTVTDGISSAYGSGSARRMAGFKLLGNGTTLFFTGQSPVELYGSQVYPDFDATGSNIRINFRLTNVLGYYFHSRTFVRIIAHEPWGTNFRYIF